ncbi:MAG: hypothetical protein ACOCZE_06670 [Planctomycetota bacterium]
MKLTPIRLLLALALSAMTNPWTELAVSAADRPMTSDIALHLTEQPGKLRLQGPKYVHGDEASFTVELPEAEAGKYEDLLLVVESRSPSSSEYATASVPAVDEQTPTAKRKGNEMYLLRTDLPAAKWKDGPARAALFAIKDDKRLVKLAEADLDVVRQGVLQKIPEASRAELALWLDHVNQHVDAWGKVPYWRNVDRVIEKPELLWAGLRGLVLRSYYNPQLDRLQPYGMYVPKAYDPDKPMPLMILLHGSGGNYLNLVSDVFHGQELESNPMLVANAGAFARQEYRHMALNDVLWVIEDVKRKYNVDADRIYLQGISLGGRGSLEIPALASGIFAAASPQGVYGIFTELTDPATTASLDPYTLAQGARWDIRTLLPNLRHTPMQFIYGMEDPTTPPHNATTLKFLLRETFGGKAEMKGFDADHNITYPVYKWSDTRKWMLGHQRAKDPRTLLFRTNALRHNRHYWLEIQELESYWQIPSVMAMLQEKQNLLILQTGNVSALSARPPKPVDKVVISGQRIQLDQPTDEVHLRKDDEGKWAIVSAEKVKPAQGRKRHGQSGPIWDVASGKMLFVYGTGGSETETANLRKVASDAARLDVHWGDSHLPVLADTDVTETHKAENNLILVGDARTNKLIAGQDWPFDLQAVGAGKGIILPPEARAQDGANVLAFVRPSPYGANRYVMVITLADPSAELEGVLRPTDTWSPYVWSDWVAMKQVEFRRRGRTYRRLSNVADGVFSPDWKLQRHQGLTRRMRYMNWQRPEKKNQRDEQD